MSENRIVITKSNFEDLVSGKEIKNEDGSVKLILQDVGFDRMIELIKKQRRSGMNLKTGSMDLTFEEMRCPCCKTQTMEPAGGTFSGRLILVKKRCSNCNLCLMIIPMSKDPEMLDNITVTTQEERTEQRIKKIIQESDRKLLDEIAQVREEGGY